MILFAVQITYAAIKARNYLAEDSSLSSKICTWVAFGVCLCVMVYNSTLIDSSNIWQLRSFNEVPFTLATVIGLVFVWWAFTILFGGILGTLQLLVLMGIHFKEIQQHRRGWLPPGSNAVLTSINAMGIAVAYNLILYTFGMADWLIIELFL